MPGAPRDALPRDSAGAFDNWGLLRSFYFIARERGITNAARVLSLTQPSLSAALKRLEKRLGHKLVQRGQREFALTAAGQVLFSEVEKMFDATCRAEERLRAFQSGLVGTVKLQVVTGAYSAILDEALRLMHQRHPTVTIQIQVASSPVIQRNVAMGDVPFGVCLMPQPLPRFECQLLLRAEYGVFCGAEHPLFGCTDVTLRSLRDTPFIAFSCDAEGNAPEPTLTLREAAGLGRIISGTSGDFYEVCRMIIMGLGIGVLPIHAVQREIAEGSLWRLDLSHSKLHADLFCISDPARHHTAAEKAFLSVMQEVILSASREKDLEFTQ
ncbi:LysR family transcriptional regulator [Leisingera sp.]|uniref:LysR family transcriptional regulator n=1 Tax=Leisingera sp. TaxID=1879318 RepID=UPI003A8E845F